MKRSNMIWWIVLLLAWSFDLLFWRQEPGVNFAIFVLLCLAGGFLALLLQPVRPDWRALLLLLPVLFFAGFSFIRSEPMSLFLAYALTLFNLVLLAVSYRSGSWWDYSLGDHLLQPLRLAGSMLVLPIKTAIEAGRGNGTQSAPGKQGARRTLAAVLRGLLIAIPILAVFAALLSSADVVFGQKVSQVLDLLSLERLPEYIFRLAYILIGAYLLAGVLLHAGLKSSEPQAGGSRKPLLPAFLGFTESLVVQAGVVLLFSLFVIIQFRYFFGGEANIQVDGYTYAEYARRGFGELAAVAAGSLLLILGLSTLVRRSTLLQRRLFSGLNIAILLLVGVMLASAFQRLALYEAAYGFSRLRLYTHIFMYWLGGLLAAVVLLEILRRSRHFMMAVTLAGLGFVATLLVLNVDAWITTRNIERAASGEELDAAYLASLSSDAVPVLVDSFQDGSLPAGLHESLGAALVCHLSERGTSEQNWRSFNLSDYRSRQLLNNLEQELSDYSFYDETQSEVLTPAGGIIPCYSGMGMD